MPGKLSAVQRRRSKRQRSLCRIQGRHGPAACGIWLLLSLAAAGSQATQAAPLGFESGLAASATEEREVDEVIGGAFADLLADTPASGARQLQQFDVSGTAVSTLPQGVQYAINALSRGSTAAEKLKAFPRCGQAHNAYRQQWDRCLHVWWHRCALICEARLHAVRSFASVRLPSLIATRC